MAEHGGGGGGSGAGFFLALFAAVAVAWFFAQMQKQERVTDDTPFVTEADSVLEVEETPEPRTSAHRSPALPQEEHGVTYYLDEDGNILDVVYY